MKPAKGRVLPADVLAMANPISCLFCCAIGTRRGVPLDFLNNYYPEEFDSRAHHGDMLQASVAPHEPLRRGFHPSLPPYVEASLNPELISDVEENSNFKIPRELGHLLSIDLRDGE